MRSEFVQRVAACAAELARRGSGAPTPPDRLGEDACWYPASWQCLGETHVFLARDGASRYLVVAGSGADADRFPGEVVAAGERPVKMAPRGPEACAALRAAFQWTAPAPLPPGRASLGCGDRLGVATPGHLRAIRRYQVAPVLAQQSVRELTLTGRTYGEVVDAATWGVFREGYRGGWGADGDHLKTVEEVGAMLAAGATFITLDLSLCLGREEGLPEMPSEVRRQEGKTWECGGLRLEVSAADVAEFWRVFGPAFAFIEDASLLCRHARGPAGFDLEVSVDETPYTTRPVDHFLLAAELERRAIPVASVAPRFPGEFQKGIDYVGDLAQLEREVALHAAIARRFGHKVGVHSGSDKFAAFPLIGRLGGERLHVKTAGTSWLEAVRVVAATDAALFRAFWAQAAEGFPRAKQYYHIRTELADVAGADAIADADLPRLLDDDACRQFLHITYGEILRAPAPGGGTLGERLQENLAANEERYAAGLERHFRRHADALGLAEV